MKSAFAFIFVSIIDLPSIISVLGGIAAKRLWQVGLVVLLASIFGELLTAFVHTAYVGPEFFLYRLIGQTIVGLIAFFLGRKLGRAKPAGQGKNKADIFYYVIILIVVLGLAGVWTALMTKAASTNPLKRAELDALDAKIRADISAQKEQEKIDFLGQP